jgi:hypothetical protein
MNTPRRRLMVVLWPAFLMAAVLEVLVFAFVDPESLHWVGGAPVEIGANTIYSLAFFAFWAIVALACAMTERLSESDEDVNSRSFR